MGRNSGTGKIIEGTVGIIGLITVASCSSDSKLGLTITECVPTDPRIISCSFLKFNRIISLIIMGSITIVE